MPSMTYLYHFSRYTKIGSYKGIEDPSMRIQLGYRQKSGMIVWRNSLFGESIQFSPIRDDNYDFVKIIKRFSIFIVPEARKLIRDVFDAFNNREYDNEYKEKTDIEQFNSIKNTKRGPEYTFIRKFKNKELTVTMSIYKWPSYRLVISGNELYRRLISYNNDIGF